MPAAKPRRAPANTATESSPRVGERMPIEEVARRTGMTVRNVRALQACGLLEPPELQGRKGFYTERHLARVGLVRRLQAQGFTLAAIGRLIEGWQAGAGLMDVAGFEDALNTPGTTGERGERGEVDVAVAFPELLKDRRALDKALRTELVVHRDGKVIAPNAELLHIVKTQVAAGMPLHVVLDEGVRLYVELERIAERFRKSFYKHVVDKFLQGGAQPSQLATLGDIVTRLRPMSVRSVTIMFSRAMERGVASPAVSASAATTAKRKAPKRSKRR